jgi:hypothetical protein
MGLFGFKSYAGSYMEKARKEYQEGLDKIAKEAKEFYYSFNDIKEETLFKKKITKKQIKKTKNILLSNDFKIFSKDEIKNILLKKREKLKLKNKETIEEEIILLKKELKKHNKKQLKRLNAFLHKQFN